MLVEIVKHVGLFVSAFIQNFSSSVEGVRVVASGNDCLLHQTQLAYFPTSHVGLGQAHLGPVDGVVHLLGSQFPNI